MENMKTALFILRPGKIVDLKRLHLLSEEEPYVIIETRRLSKIDYENFIEDMLVYRDYLEIGDIPQIPGVHQCILVVRRGHPTEGILVDTTGAGNVKYAACIPVA